MASKARDLSNFISVATIDATEIATNAITTDKIADSAITHAKLHTTMDLSGKTVSFAVNQISGNAIDGGVISNFTSTGVDDNATSTKLTVSDTGIDVTGTVTAGGLVVDGTAAVNDSNDSSTNYLNSDANLFVSNTAGTNTTNLKLENDAAIVYGGGANTLVITDRQNERLRIDSSGNVGIGVVPVAAWDTFTTLQIEGSSLSGLSENNTILGSNIYHASNNFKYYGTGAATVYQQRLGEHRWSGAASGTAGNTASMTQHMVIDSSGNVGIGTSSPYASAKLQIKTATNINVAFQTGTEEPTGIKINAFNDAANANIPLELNGSVTLLKTGEVERLRIDSAGNVGIGLASNIGAALHVDPAANVTTGFGTPLIKVGGANSWAGTGSLYSIGFGYTDSAASYSPAEIGLVTTSGASHTKGALVFATRDSGSSTIVPTERLRIDSAGNVGIGVTPESWPSNGDFVGLQVGSGLSLYGRGAGDEDRVGMTANAYLDANDSRFEYIGTGHATHYSMNDGAHYFQVAPSGTADAAISWTTAMTIDNAGIVTKPYQPAFSVWPASTQSNISVNAWTTILFDTEFFDQNQDFSSSTFTAPVTGKYQLNASVRFNVDDGALYYHVQIETSNASHRTTDHTRNFANADIDYFTQTISVLADMDAGDTAFLKIYQSQGSAITDIDNDTRFSGFLAC